MSAAQHTTSVPPVEYRSLPDFPGYRFGDDGSFWGRRGEGWRLLKGWPHRDGYIAVQMVGIDGKIRSYLLHRLILEAFVGPCPEGREACHNDGNPTNNHLGNLRWDTHEANMQDAVRHGTLRSNPRRGSRHSGAKLTEADIPAIRRLLVDGVRPGEIARRFGIDRYQVYSIKVGKTWTHVPNEHGDLSKVGSRKGARGGENGRAILCEADVIEIKRLIASGRSNSEIAARFGVSGVTISKIRTGLTWRHVQ